MRDKVRAVGRWFADLPGGRTTKFAVLAVWLIILIVIGPLAGKFEDAQENDPADYLPGKAESVQAIDALEDFPSGDIAEAITVFSRDSGLTAGDRARSPRDDRRRPPRGSRRDRPADPLQGRQRGPADHPDHGRGRKQRGRRAARRRDRRHQGRRRGPSRGSRGQGDRAGRLLGRRDRRLRLDQRGPALRDRGARADPADHHLPQPDLLADPVLLGDPRRGDLARDGLSARRGRSDGDGAVGRDPAGAGLRRRHRLRPAARLAIPGRAATSRGQARCGPRRDAQGGPGDRRLGGDRDGRAADADAGRGQRHVRARPDRGHGGRPGDDRDADDPSRAARDHRAPGLLAVHPAGRQRGHRRDARHLEPDRGLGRPRPSSRLDRDHRRPAGPLPRPDPAQQRPDQRQRLPRRRRLGGGPEADREELPGRRQRADQRRRHRRVQARRGRDAVAPAPGVAEISPRRSRGRPAPSSR